ncbi:MAG: DUF2974 domain-containing protein [Clostridia bacterium]|nr:DUF2974 domain-containing protein [Clostridia bacterium]
MNNNVFDYLDWRGDLTFDIDGFNEVDNLVLSVLSYIDFSGVVPTEPGGGQISLAEAERRLTAMSRDRQELGLIIPDQTCDFMKRAAKTPRFSEIMLCSYVDKIDPTLGIQFSAVTFLLPDRTLFIAFRGTDDTLVGWKENFNMSFAAPVPAQVSALDYLIDIAHARRGKIRVGGHSKGGNLAIWAAVNAPARIQRRIIAAYNNDGPGFEERITEKPEYKAIEERLFTFVPESSVVGMLLEHSESYMIVKSFQNTLWQHDPFSWVIRGREFIKTDDRSSFSKHTDRVLGEWIASMSYEERRHATDVLFEVLESTGAKTLSDLNASKAKNLTSIIRSINHIDKNTRDKLSELVRRLFEFDRIFEWK